MALAIGVDFGGSLGTCPPIIENCPCIYHFLPPFHPSILVCPPNIFDKSTPLALAHIGQKQLLYLHRKTAYDCTIEPYISVFSIVSDEVRNLHRGRASLSLVQSLGCYHVH